VSILPWVASRGRSYGFLLADSSIEKNVRKDDFTPAYSPVSNRRHLAALVEVHRDFKCRCRNRRTQLIGEPHHRSILRKGRTVSRHKAAALRKWEGGISDTSMERLTQLSAPWANSRPIRESPTNSRGGNQYNANHRNMQSFDSAEWELSPRAVEILSRRRCQLQCGRHIVNSP
jgi:hypothetical protein